MKIARSFVVASALVAASLAAAPGFAEEALNAQTKTNLEAAMHGEAFANLKYQAYAEHARKSGHPEIAKLFDENANVEASEHFAREADALGLARRTRQTFSTAWLASTTKTPRCMSTSPTRRTRQATRRWPRCSGRSPPTKATTIPPTRTRWRSCAPASEFSARRERSPCAATAESCATQ